MKWTISAIVIAGVTVLGVDIVRVPTVRAALQQPRSDSEDSRRPRARSMLPPRRVVIGCQQVLSRSDRNWCVSHDEGRSKPISKLCNHDFFPHRFEPAFGCIGKWCRRAMASPPGTAQILRHDYVLEIAAA